METSEGTAHYQLFVGVDIASETQVVAVVDEKSAVLARQPPSARTRGDMRSSSVRDGA